MKQLDVLADFVPSDFFTVGHLPRSTRENEHPFLPGDGSDSFKHRARSVACELLAVSYNAVCFGMIFGEACQHLPYWHVARTCLWAAWWHPQSSFRGL